MSSAGPERTKTTRTGATALLFGFVLALLLGAVHPLGGARAHTAHVCGAAAERHVEAQHHAPHDATTCALCHLAHEAAVVDDVPPLLPEHAFCAPAPSGPVRRRPGLSAPSTAQPRAPPATPAFAS